MGEDGSARSERAGGHGLFRRPSRSVRRFGRRCGGNRYEALPLRPRRGRADAWGEVQRLAYPDPIDSFDVDGDRLLVGVSNTAFVLENDSGGSEPWSTVGVLTRPEDAGFASSVSLSGDTGAVASDEAVYVLYRDVSTGGWSFAKTLPIPGFVAISGDTLVVSGLHVFDRDSGGIDNWGRIATLAAPESILAPNAILPLGTAVGRSIILRGDPDADIDSDNRFRQGAVQVFRRDEGGPWQWRFRWPLLWGDVGSESGFGSAVAISNQTMVVGGSQADAPQEDSGAAVVYPVDSEPRETCTVSPVYSGGALRLDFTLGVSPGVWEVWVSTSSGMARLWSLPLPYVDPPVSFPVVFETFPRLGRIGFLSTFRSSVSMHPCSDWSLVDTGDP